MCVFELDGPLVAPAHFKVSAHVIDWLDATRMLILRMSGRPAYRHGGSASF